MEPFIGQIQAFAFGFNPRGWAHCNGQLLAINQNTSLFSLIGTTYGGDGRTTFGLPDLRGRVPIQQGHGPGLSPYALGVKGGLEQVTLLEAQLPEHKHNAVVNAADPIDRGADSTTPKDSYWAVGDKYATNNNVKMASDSVETKTAGGGLPHENRPPYIALNYCIALVGIYPSRS